MKIVINTCYGGFGISQDAYKWLIKHGVPVKKYIQEKRGSDGLYKRSEENSGEVIFDRKLSLGEEGPFNDEEYMKFMGRYWDCWIDDYKNRSHPLIIKCVEKLGKKSFGKHADLKIVDIPDNVDWEISDYDGREHIAEKHRTWS